MSFHEPPDNNTKFDFWRFMEILIDVVFATDIIINFISAYERKDGSYEYQFK